MPAVSAAEWAEEVQALHELVPRARQRLPQHLWDYIAGGAETETTVLRNRAALDSLALVPAVLEDVSAVDLRTRVLGMDLALPVIVAPMGSLTSFDAGGGAAAARATARAGAALCLSVVSPPGLERTAAAARGAKMFQLYVDGDADWVDEWAGRARRAGYAAFCITVDSAVYGRRERDVVNRWRKPWVGGAHHSHRASFSWADVARFKRRWPDFPLVLKGVARPADARRAVDLGVEAVWVSNHGGRQLDHGRGSIAALPAVVDAVARRAAVIVDGGVMRGTDVAKALALGADAVAVGRLAAIGLAAGGEEGLARALDLLRDELRTALALLGAPRPAALSRDHVTAAPPVRPPHALSAFPLLPAGARL